jgi:hemerythrin
VRSAFRELRTETDAHFAREERLMREAKYPGLEYQRMKHHRLCANSRRWSVEAVRHYAETLPPSRPGAHLGHAVRGQCSRSSI